MQNMSASYIELNTKQTAQSINPINAVSGFTKCFKIQTHVANVSHNTRLYMCTWNAPLHVLFAAWYNVSLPNTCMRARARVRLRMFIKILRMCFGYADNAEPISTFFSCCAQCHASDAPNFDRRFVYFGLYTSQFFVSSDHWFVKTSAERNQCKTIVYFIYPWHRN